MTMTPNHAASPLFVDALDTENLRYAAERFSKIRPGRRPAPDDDRERVASAPAGASVTGHPICLCSYCLRDAISRNERGQWACGRHMEAEADG